jgi:hypothetical protein
MWARSARMFTGEKGDTTVDFAHRDNVRGLKYASVSFGENVTLHEKIYEDGYKLATVDKKDRQMPCLFVDQYTINIHICQDNSSLCQV